MSESEPGAMECYWCHRTDVELFPVGGSPWMTTEGVRFVCQRDRWWRWWDVLKIMLRRADEPPH